MRWLVRGLKVLLAVLALVLAVLVAWVASNWHDDDARPLPPELALGAPQAGPPLFFVIQGLLAAPDVQPEQAGRAAWAALHAPAAAASASAAAVNSATLPRIKGPPLVCEAPQDCVKQLTADVAQVAQQLAPHTLLGERCTAAAADARYADERPPAISLSAPFHSLAGLTSCGAWFKGQAVLAAARGDREAALQRLRAGMQLAQGVIAGGSMLITTVVAGTVVRGQYEAVAAVAALQPTWAADLTPLAAPLPASALQPQRWVLTEAAFVRGTFDQMLRDCADPRGPGLNLGGDDWALRLACRSGIGLLPNATRQALDGQWLATFNTASQGLGPMVDAAIERRRSHAPPAQPAWAWRNTLGQALIAAAEPSLDSYAARQADVDLHRQALALALAATSQRVPLAGRDAWLARQTLDARTRSRIGWQDQGATLVARPWVAELGADASRSPPIRLAVPAL